MAKQNDMKIPPHEYGSLDSKPNWGTNILTMSITLRTDQVTNPAHINIQDRLLLVIRVSLTAITAANTCRKQVKNRNI